MKRTMMKVLTTGTEPVIKCTCCNAWLQYTFDEVKEGYIEGLDRPWRFLVCPNCECEVLMREL